MVNSKFWLNRSPSYLAALELAVLKSLWSYHETDQIYAFNVLKLVAMPSCLKLCFMFLFHSGYKPPVAKLQVWKERKDSGKVEKMNRTHVGPPHDIDIVRGSAYGIFSRKFVEFIVNDKRAKDLLEWSKDTYSPDEHYWATLHHTFSNPHLHTPGGYSGNVFRHTKLGFRFIFHWV